MFGFNSASPHHKPREINHTPQRIPQRRRIHRFFDFAESLLEEITVAEDVEEVGGVSGVVKSVVLSAGEIDSGPCRGRVPGDPSFESDVRIEFILEIGPLSVDQTVFFVGKLVFFKEDLFTTWL